MSKTYTITLTEAQDKALSVVAYDVHEWIESTAINRAMVAIEEIALAEIQRKLAAGETISGTKDDIVLVANIETAKERSDRIRAEFESQQG